MKVTGLHKMGKRIPPRRSLEAAMDGYLLIFQALAAFARNGHETCSILRHGLLQRDAIRNSIE